MKHHYSNQSQGHEAAQLHLLMAQLLELTERVAALERAMYGSKTVRGWVAAARVLDLGISTVRRRFKSDPSFPKPSRTNAYKCGRVMPEWPLSSLLNYKNEPRR